MRKKTTKNKNAPRPGKKSQAVISGTLECNPRGFGFVRPDQTEGPDIFISPRDMGEAVHKDKVEVRAKTGRDGRKSGTIVRVIERGSEKIVGYFNQDYVAPRDSRVSLWIKIPKNKRNGAKDGDVVQVKLTKYPQGEKGASGEVIEVLGRADQVEVESKVILREHGFSEQFPSPVLDLARSLPQKLLPTELKGREDLRGIYTVTIDPKDARDFDDAMSIKRTDQGYTLWVSIADVSHYVKSGSVLDSEAYERGTSVYFPGQAIHMLPEELSAGILSLKPRVNRLAMTAQMQFDKNGKRLSARCYPSVIKSDQRFNYEQVEAMLIQRDPEMREKYKSALSPLRDMLQLAKLRIKRRENRGSIDMDVPEAKVILGPGGEVVTIAKRERLFAHRLVEEFMLVANEAVADYLTEAKLGLVYRIHEPPDPRAVENLAGFLTRIGLRLLDKKQDPERVRPQNYQRLFKDAAGKPEEPLVGMLALRSMMQACYSTKNKGHFGLAAERYCHFTSPIRRYPDLIVHRLLKQHLGFSKESPAPDSLEQAAAQSSERERAATGAEREMMDVYSVRYMSSRLGHEYHGMIAGLTDFGMFVMLEEVFIEGMIRLDTLDDEYIFEEKEHCLRGRRRGNKFKLGDKIKVLAESVNLERRQVTFRLIGKA